MSAPTYAIVCEELHAARQHLYDLIGTLSRDEMLWRPNAPPHRCIGAHFARGALNEDDAAAAIMSKRPKASAALRAGLEAYEESGDASALPSPSEVLEYALSVRENTQAIVAMQFRAVRDDEQACRLAEPFRGIINQIYERARMIAVVRRAMGKPEVEPPPSARVTTEETDEGVLYRLPGWEKIEKQEPATRGRRADCECLAEGAQP